MATTIVAHFALPPGEHYTPTLASASMADLVIERCLPSARAAEIQALFSRAGQPEFRTVFERVYKVREQVGLRSWIGLVGDQAVLHISVAPQPFSDGVGALTGGLLGDLMADPSQRDFWGPLRLARRMVSDVRKDRTADFLLTSYLPAAEGVFRAAGFKQFAVLRRYVLPLIWPYPLLRRLQHGQRLPRLTAIPFGDEGIDALLRGIDSPGCFRPVRGPEYFTTRIPRVDYPTGTWLLAGAPQAPDAIVLVSPNAKGGLLVADVMWRGASTELAGLLSAVARWAAHEGHRRLTLTTIPGSLLSAAGRESGFLLRPDTYPVLMLSVCPPEIIPPPEQWSLTPFVLTAW